MTSASEVAVVTGANRGIGREIVSQLAAAGYTVLACARSLPSGDQIHPVGQRVSVHSLDVTNADSDSSFAAATGDTYGHLDILINNAGAHYDTAQHATDPDFDVVTDAFAVNMLGARRTTAALVPLITNGGRIVNVSSGAGSFTETGGAAGTPAYAVTKAALNMLTVRLAAELTDRQIAVNAVCPGWVATEWAATADDPSPRAPPASSGLPPCPTPPPPADFSATPTKSPGEPREPLPAMTAPPNTR